mmetsp:Transcript_46403/g.112493  ORF Transcript_46403/g.112493 Transcript_46403/m.112493 type:complete len:100 (-) Transcript_46403:928-1227(-)
MYSCPTSLSQQSKWQIKMGFGDDWYATATYHDATKDDSSKTPTTSNNELGVHGNFDAVLFTDISSSFDGRHRASAGIPDTFRAKLPPRVRIPLFSYILH